MHDSMVSLIETYNLIPPNSTVLCAVSGGADSISLLHRLYHLRPVFGFHLVAAHYNHQLRGGEAFCDAEFVQQFVSLCCTVQKLPQSDGSIREYPAVPLVSGCGDVAKEARLRKQGLEETAREMRYMFLYQVARQVGADYIATAHHANDNMETILLHLVRGCGLRGLSGIPPKRGLLIRPLLTTRRQEIEQYLRYHGLPWREDPSNRDLSYTRNRIRYRVLPELEALNPNLMERISTMAQSVWEDEEYLTQAAKTQMGEVQQEPCSCSASAHLIGQMPPPLARRAVRILLGLATQGNDNCTSYHLEQLVALCHSLSPSASLSLPNGLLACREYDRLVLKHRPAVTLSEEIPLSMVGETVSGTWVITCEPTIYQGQAQGAFCFFLSQSKCPILTVRCRKRGDLLTLPKRPRKTVKKWMIDEKIPAHVRNTLPVFVADGQLAAVAHLGPDVHFLPAKGELAWQIQCKMQTPHLQTQNSTHFPQIV